MNIDPLRFEVFKNLFVSVADEMGTVLTRAAYSVNIKERKDASCAIFDARGRMIAQAEHIPVHLGSMPESVKAALRAFPTMAEGDCVIVNDPYQGGTHLPDVTLVMPVFDRRRLTFFTAARAHFSDVGGMSPGSMPVSREIFQEGLILPPVKLTADVRRIFLANVRNPFEDEGDLEAQQAACDVGAKRLKAILSRYGRVETLRYAGGLLDYAETLMRRAIRRIPSGTYRFDDVLDNDGIDDRPVTIRCAVTIRGDRATVDFAGSSPQVKGNINAVFAVTLSSVLYCFRCLIPEEIPANAGCLRPLHVFAPEGSAVHAQRPAACVAGNVEMSQRIVDVVFGALAKAVPELIPAASSGSMSNVSFGGYDPVRRRSFAYYETIAGGMGARPTSAGEDAVHTHMTNTLNSPVEVLENEYPLRVTRYEIRPNSRSTGRYPGGAGLVREFEFLTDVTCSVLSDRRTHAPYGLRGGAPGKPGRNTLTMDGKKIPMPGKFVRALPKGSRLTIETPGGGAYGRS
jgi:N-methylhydantoinase B